MRIISSFKDFYDSAWPAYTEPIYLRTFEEWDVMKPELHDYPVLAHFINRLKEMPELPHFAYRVGKDQKYYGLSSSFLIIGTTIFHCFMPGRWVYACTLKKSQRDEKEVHWAPEDALEYILKKNKVSRHDAEHYRSRFTRGVQGVPHKFRWMSDLKDWTKALKALTSKGCTELCVELGAPVAQIVMQQSKVVGKEWSVVKVIRNPKLLDLDVGKYLPPTEVWQLIYMMLNGPLAKQADPIPKRTQRLISDAHGFNEHSFRNSKGKVKRRKGEA